jgi:16S rRNA U516 pseudouridylate synthase RsuA-like enzyme
MSKGEVKKLVEAGSISINQEKINKETGQQKPNFKKIKNKYYLIKKSKHYFLTEIE